MTSRQPSCACIACGKDLDAATGVTKAGGPKSGDVSICLYCGNIAIFGKHRRLRPPTDAEMATIVKDPRVIEMQQARAEVMKGWKQ